MMKRTPFYAVVVLWLVAFAAIVSGQAGVLFTDGLRFNVETLSVANNGIGSSAASGTVTVLKTYVEATCNDPDGCNLTISETGAREGMRLIVVNVGTNTCNFADTGGVTEIAGAFAAGQYDSLSLIYIGDRWVELARANN